MPGYPAKGPSSAPVAAPPGQTSWVVTSPPASDPSAAPSPNPGGRRCGEGVVRRHADHPA
jgi:hypothetical protein